MHIFWDSISVRMLKRTIYSFTFLLLCFHAAAQKQKQVSSQALIPHPREISYSKGSFALQTCKVLVVKDASLAKEASFLQQLLLQKGINTHAATKTPAKGPYIRLAVSSAVKEKEGYKVTVSPAAINVEAANSQGIFNGIQTLKQLIKADLHVDACMIKDAPAFSMRGYMVDVGRNYQSLELLKQQIDIMAQYKLNVLHFHATEDIAWRFASKRYPQLTAAENMIRNKGKYYSEADVKELISYCKDRHIIFIPEIDMPGHSAAFTRAMKTNMQTDSGVAIVKNILTEFIDTYKLPYFHVGGDEVHITNKNFLPEMIKLIQSKGVKTLAWSPGGNIDEATIRQLWMDDVGRIEKSTHSFIDSRHLYLNHMDPFEGVTTLFNRRIGDKMQGDSSMLGAILCLWPDRRVEREEDALKMNLVYPGMLAFAERTWRGGGLEKWVANIGSPGEERTNTFAEFENRLLSHKKRYFGKLPFPYVKQQHLVWNLYGPYDNGGDVVKKFSPELNKGAADVAKLYGRQVGATIVLRHWWAPLIAGAIDPVAKENSTWYASTRIWSEKGGTQNFWIGFNNISRSPATDSPPAGAWDLKGSEVWVNGALVAPPAWKRGGEKGHPEIPLIDEGYEYRAPTRIMLKKGWNDVLIKAPIASFKGKDWQNPVKWMFTFVPVD